MKKKVRVLQILHGLAPAGTEAFVLNNVDHLDKEKLEISYLIAVDHRQYHQDYVEALGHKVYMTCDLNGIVKLFTHFVRLYRTIKRNGPFDVCHSHMDFLNGLNLFVAYLAGIKIRISHSHNAAKIADNILVKWYRKTMKVINNMFSTVKLGCSDEANKFLYGDKHNKKAIVIYNGIDLSRFSVVKREHKLNFITVGRMVRQKNCLFIVDIIYELKKKYPEVKLAWVGDGTDRKKVEERIDKLDLSDNIDLLGVRKDVPNLLRDANYFLFPSLFEGLGIVLIEAQATDITCFVSDTVPSLANVGLCMSIPLTLTASAWAEKISDHIENNNTKLKLDKESLKKFDIRSSSKEIERIYLQKSK